jgi:hypothetical protein
MIGLIHLSMIIAISISCSSNISAKKLKRRDFLKRTYRFCSPVEVEDAWGKLCYRMCRQTILGRCVKTELIVEDLTDEKTHRKFLFGGFSIKK